MAIGSQEYLLEVALMVGALLALAGVASAVTPTALLEQPPFSPTGVGPFDPATYAVETVATEAQGKERTRSRKFTVRQGDRL